MMVMKKISVDIDSSIFVLKYQSLIIIYAGTRIKKLIIYSRRLIRPLTENNERNFPFFISSKRVDFCGCFGAATSAASDLTLSMQLASSLCS